MVSSSGLTESMTLFIQSLGDYVMANNNGNTLNPVSIYFDSVEAANVWADAHPEVYLTIWGETQSGKVRGSFVLRKKYEQHQQNTEAVPAL